MEKVIRAYQAFDNVEKSPFDKVVTIEGEVLETATYRKRISKQQEPLAKPMVQSPFSRYLETYM